MRCNDHVCHQSVVSLHIIPLVCVGAITHYWSRYQTVITRQWHYKHYQAQTANREADKGQDEPMRGLDDR